MRPSKRHPTLELRAPDTCTFVDDAVAIASLYRCLTRHLYLRPHLSKEVTAVERAIAVENKWRAQRYGTDCIFASKDGPVTISEMLSRIIDDTVEDADVLGCAAEIEHCRAIVDRGSSAEFQLRAYRDNGDDIAAVSRWIAESTVSGISAPIERSTPAQS